MNLLKTLAKFSVGTWVQAVLSLISTPIIAWLVAPEEFGKSSMFILAYNLTMNIAFLAVDQGFARFYNETASKPTLLQSAFPPLIATFSLCAVIIELAKAPINQFLFNSSNSHVVHLLTLALAGGIILRLANVALRMRGLATRYSLVQIIQALINFAATVFYAIYFDASFIALIFGLIVSQTIAAVIAIVFYWPIWSGMFSKPKIDRRLMKNVLLYSLPFVPTFLLDWFFQGVDRTFLRIFSDFTQIGLYATASKIAYSLNIVQTGFTTFWFPYSLERYSKYPENKAPFTTVFNSLVCVFSLLILLIIIFQKILLLILPKSYSGVVPIFPLLLLVPMLYTISEVTAVGINFKKKTIQHLYIILISLLGNTLTGWVFIPRFGAAGAAAAMSVGYVFFFMCRTYFGRTNYPFEVNIKKFGLAMVFVVAAILLTILSSNLFYFVCILGIIVNIFIYKNDLINLKKL